jgi:hypothetical protein
MAHAVRNVHFARSQRSQCAGRQSLTARGKTPSGASSQLRVSAGNVSGVGAGEITSRNNVHASCAAGSSRRVAAEKGRIDSVSAADFSGVMVLPIARTGVDLSFVLPFAARSQSHFSGEASHLRFLYGYDGEIVR